MARQFARGMSRLPGRAPSPQTAVTLRALAAATPEGRLALLETRESGLTAAEAAAALRQRGLNQPVTERVRHPARELLSNFNHTLALLLWFAAGLAFAAGIHELGAAILSVV